MLRNCGVIDPAADRRLHRPRRLPGPGQGARRTTTPEEVIETMRASGLRGRGGAGFPTWRKWKLTRDAAGRREVRRLQRRRGRPRRVHGPQRAGRRSAQRRSRAWPIAAHTIGADEGYIYVRAEYPLAVERLQHRHRPGPRARPAGQEHPRHADSTSTWRSAWAPGRSSAAKRRP